MPNDKQGVSKEFDDLYTQSNNLIKELGNVILSDVISKNDVRLMKKLNNRIQNWITDIKNLDENLNKKSD